MKRELTFRPFAEKRAEIIRAVVSAKVERDRSAVDAWLTPKRRVRVKRSARERLLAFCEQIAGPVRGTLSNIVML